MPAVSSLDPNKQNRAQTDPNAAQGQAGGTTNMQAGTLLPSGGGAAPGGSNVPYVTNNNQLLPVTPAPKPPKPPATDASLAQGNRDVLGTAQDVAISGATQQNPIMGMVQQAVQNLITNPMGPGYDRNRQLEQYDRNRANAMQANQQASADVANTGVNMNKAYQFAMQGAQGRSDLDTTLAETERKALLESLGLGTSTAQAQSGLDDAAFNRLITARTAGEGERSQTQGFQNDVALSKLGFGQDVQMAAINNGYDLGKLNTQYGYDMAKMVAQNNWQGVENEIDRLWKTGEADAGRKHDAFMADLTTKLGIARDNNDTVNEEKILRIQADLTATRDATLYGYDVAKTNLDASIATAAANNDTANEKILIQKRWDVEAEQRIADNARADLALAYQGRTVTLGENQFTFEQVETMVENGQMSPETAVGLFKQQNPDVVVTAPDPNATQQAIKDDYVNAQYQYALTAPGGLDAVANFDAQGNFTGLKPTALTAFNKWSNDTNYQGAGTSITGGTPGVTVRDGKIYDAQGNVVTDASTALRNANSPNNQNYSVYQQLVTSSPALNVGIQSAILNKLSGLPSEGAMVSYNGRLFTVGSVTNSYAAFETDKITITDVATGKSQTFTGRKTNGGGGKTVNELGTWVNALPQPAA
jgi:hypothetical protein